MENLIKKSLFTIVILVFPALAVCQNSAEVNRLKDESPYKTMNLKFVLAGSPSLEDVGFNNPKSFWQFRYELRFLSEKFPFKYFKEKENESQKERQKRIRKNNKDYDKGWKKHGILVASGKVMKTNLLSAGNREIIIPVNLTPEIMSVLANAAGTWQNPDFRISLNGKISTQTNSKLKFKRKTNPSFVCPTKVQTKEAQYWIMNTCGISIEIRKMEAGKIVFGWLSRIN